MQLRMQTFGIDIPYQFLFMLSYVLAVLVTAVVVGKAVRPAALGIPHGRE